jgi:hypothetical protein
MSVTLGDKEHLLPDDRVREDLAATVFEENVDRELLWRPDALNVGFDAEL